MLILLLILIALRPFISSLALPHADLMYSIVITGLLLAGALTKKMCFKKIRTLTNPLLLFCLALCVSVVFSFNKAAGIQETYNYITGFLLFGMAASLPQKEAEKIIRTVIFTGCVISLIAIYQYFFGYRHLAAYVAKEKITDPFVLDYIKSKRVFAPFVTPNVLAGYLIMIIPLALHLKNKFLLIPLFLALALTKSLGALATLFLIAILYLYHLDTIDKKKVALFMSLSLIIGLTIMIRSNTAQHTQPDFSIAMRLTYWKETFSVIKAFPFSGTGPGNFNLGHSRYSHNSYLQVWAELGVLGISGLLWFFYLSLRNGIKRLRESGQLNFTSLGIVTASAAFIIHNVTEFTFFLPEVAMIFWIILGLNLSEREPPA
jgi:putative inorganic carbon (HCO3(-)) transporter